jgi:hypothetical protein
MHRNPMPLRRHSVLLLCPKMNAVTLRDCCANPFVGLWLQHQLAG